MRPHLAFALATVVAGCVADVGEDELGGGGGKGDGTGSCELPQYGDGTCQIDLACDVPDIDCFVTFDTDAAAAAWVGTEYGALIAETDPRHIRARRLLDQAWELFKARFQLGKLEDKRVSLVVLDGEANAFVLPDLDGLRGGHVVSVMTGSLAEGAVTDLQLLGTFVHELRHISGLHWLPEVDERIRKYYVAPDGSEPLGYQQQQHARAKELASAWNKEVAFTGSYSMMQLGALPYRGNLQEVINQAFYNPGACSTTAQAVRELYTPITTSALDYSITIPADLAARIQPALDAFSACWKQNNPTTLRQLVTPMGTDWLAYIEENVNATLLEGSAIEALMTIVTSRRQAMRTIEETFATETTRPWSALRYFSFEEQADDARVQVLAQGKLDTVEAAGMFLFYLADERAACESAYAANTVPYGVDLSDPHHGTCWRYAHARQLAGAAQTSARIVVDTVPEREAHVPRPAATRRPIY